MTKKVYKSLQRFRNLPHLNNKTQKILHRTKILYIASLVIKLLNASVLISSMVLYEFHYLELVFLDKNSLVLSLSVHMWPPYDL